MVTAGCLYSRNCREGCFSEIEASERAGMYVPALFPCTYLRLLVLLLLLLWLGLLLLLSGLLALLPIFFLH